MAESIQRELGQLAERLEALCSRVEDLREEAWQRFRDGGVRFDRIEALINGQASHERNRIESLRNRVAALEWWRSMLAWLFGVGMAGAALLISWMRSK